MPFQLASTRSRRIAHRIGLLVSLLPAVATGCDDSTDSPPSTGCCEAADQPGNGDNPMCIEGTTCCADGTWACNHVDGTPFCDEFDGVCTSAAGCDPGLEPGAGDNPLCIEGATCCPDGRWQCNDVGGSSAC
jgi:hypothetical protein